MNELSTMLYRINFRYILDHFLDQALWKKSWRIYEYDDCILEMRLTSINIQENKLQLTIKRPNSWGTYTLSLPLAKEHFNEAVFYKSLFSNMSQAISGAEFYEIANSAPYRAAGRAQNDVDDANREKAKNHLDELGIEDKAVRKAYIEAFVADNSVSLTSNVVEQLKYRIHSSRYLMLAYQFENIVPEQSEELIKTVRNKCLGDGVDQQIEQITQALSLFNYEEMTSLSDALDYLKEKQQEEEDE